MALPEPGIPAGYAALIARFELEIPLAERFTAITQRHHPRSNDQWLMGTPRYAPAQGLAGQLTFALRYEGLESGGSRAPLPHRRSRGHRRDRHGESDRCLCAPNLVSLRVAHGDEARSSRRRKGARGTGRRYRSAARACPRRAFHPASRDQQPAGIACILSNGAPDIDAGRLSRPRFQRPGPRHTRTRSARICWRARQPSCCSIIPNPLLRSRASGRRGPARRAGAGDCAGRNTSAEPCRARSVAADRDRRRALRAAGFARRGRFRRCA